MGMAKAWPRESDEYMAHTAVAFVTGLLSHETKQDQDPDSVASPLSCASLTSFSF
jgi:hypothetical protein